MKRILFAAGLIAASAPAYATGAPPLQPEETRETLTVGAPEHMTVQDNPLSPKILKNVKPGSDDDEIWGLSAPPGTSLGTDLTAKICEIAQKEQEIKQKEKIINAALTQPSTEGEKDALQFAGDTCRLSDEAGSAYHIAFRKFHATVMRGTGISASSGHTPQKGSWT